MELRLAIYILKLPDAFNIRHKPLSFPGKCHVTFLVQFVITCIFVA